MSSGVRTRFSDLAERRPLLFLALIGLVTATAAAAAPLTQPYNRAALASVVEKAVSQAATVEPAQAPILVQVWAGMDLDGDGRGDFVNPTGQAPRTEDAYGFGHFGARRDAGSRRHEGVDYVARAGQSVVAPISGFVTKVGYAYPGEQSLMFVEVTNPALQVAARVFYIEPDVEVGQAIAMGRPIGRAKSLQRKYPGGMTDHVHLEIIDRRGIRIDAERIITAEYRPAPESAAD